MDEFIAEEDEEEEEEDIEDCMDILIPFSRSVKSNLFFQMDKNLNLKKRMKWKKEKSLFKKIHQFIKDLERMMRIVHHLARNQVFLKEKSDTKALNVFFVFFFFRVKKATRQYCL